MFESVPLQFVTQGMKHPFYEMVCSVLENQIIGTVIVSETLRIKMVVLC